jgi:hypothetical protein
VTLPSLIVLAAGMSTRYGRPKQLEPVGPAGETLLDYGIFDARRAGFGRVVLIIRRQLEGPMRAHMAAHWPDLEVGYVYQELSAGRTKPWGTAHAVLAAKERVDGPAAVCNADDFYGTDGYRALGAHLVAGPSPDPALVAYRLGDTLSSHGGVSRGVCQTDSRGRLISVVELHDLRAAGGVARGKSPAGTEREVSLDAPVSMNLWGLTPAMLPLLEEGFAGFSRRYRDDPAAEYPIPTAVNEMVTSGAIAVRVLPVGKDWMGITHPDDRAAVADRLRELVRVGRYPSPVALNGSTRAPSEGSATK